ncbi:MAG: HAMP domain-containing histidine kinase [Candidatus Thermoplasmatota archaeon]|nr:HAMP domain-containing histidine kinase [Candidatus Thermoplasmatota archaeon]
MQNQISEDHNIFDEKEIRIKELEKKLKETEEKLNQLQKQNQSNRELGSKVVDNAIEINRLLQHKSRFIDNLSHDLATPITPLLSLLPLIKEELQNEKSKELLDTCIRNVEYIKRVINNSRELADIGATNFIFKRENLAEIVDQLIKKYDVVFKGYNVKTQNSIDRCIIIKTEKDRLLQLLDHLTSNAINSMPNGGLIRFEAKQVKKENKTFIQITVTDTGIGLTREQTDHIFEEFYKTDNSRHKLDSTGLGLTICKTIIEKHGGKIWADSHGPGTGASIHFTVPSKESIHTRSF